MSRLDRGRLKEKDLHVVLIERPQRPPRRSVQITILVATAVVAAGAVLVTREALAGPTTPASTLDAKVLAAAAAAPAPPAAPVSTRLALLGPRVLLSIGGPIPARVDVPVALPELPQGSTALLLEVTLSQAAAAGDVTITSGAGQVNALRLAQAGAQMTATVIVPVRATDTTLRLRASGGGRPLVNLVGAFEPAQAATSGRIVAVAPTEVIHLVPKGGSKDVTVDLSAVPLLQGHGFSAVLLQFAGDVGANGGFVAAGPSPDRLGQKIMWNPTTAQDRIRGGFMVVPMTRGSLHVHYEAGNVLTADLVGYVTDDKAEKSQSGLIVAVPAANAASPVSIGPDQDANIPLGPIADRAKAALMTLTATGDTLGGIAVHAPGTPAQPNPTLVVATGEARQTMTLAGTANGAAAVFSSGGATVTLTPLAFVL